jgi:hypothetical protein
MDRKDSYGTLTNNQRPSRPHALTNLSILKATENPISSEFVQPTQDGGNSSHMREVTSSMLETAIRFLKLKETKMQNSLKLLSTRRQVVRTRDGELFMLTNQMQLRPRESMKNLASISTDHSISDQECQ